MYDSIDVSAIPANADIIAGYVDGHWPTVSALRARFPHARILAIAVFASDDADCLDVETGDATPGQAPGWVARQRARGVYRPVLYSSVSGVAALLGVLAAAGITRDQVRLWGAHYTMTAHICGPSSCAYPTLLAECDGTQFTDRSHGRSLDESLLAPTFFDGPPAPRHTPAPQGDNDMFTLPTGAGQVVALPVPKSVLGAGVLGALGIVTPSVVRFTTNSPAQLEYMLGASGKWVTLQIDYNRSPAEVNLAGAAVVKVRRQDGGANLVTGDFA